VRSQTYAGLGGGDLVELLVGLEHQRNDLLGLLDLRHQMRERSGGLEGLASGGERRHGHEVGDVLDLAREVVELAQRRVLVVEALEQAAELVEVVDTLADHEHVMQRDLVHGVGLDHQRHQGRDLGLVQIAPAVLQDLLLHAQDGVLQIEQVREHLQAGTHGRGRW